jgi:hypothetical protein
VCLLLPELDGAPLRHFLDIFETYLWTLQMCQNNIYM